MSQPTAQFQYPPPPVGFTPSKSPRRWLRWAIPLVAFVLGLGIGASGDATDPTSTPQFLSLQSQLESSQQETDRLSDEVEDAKAEIRSAGSEAEAGLEQRVAELEQQAAELEQRSAEVETRAQEVYAREKAVRAAEKAAVVPEYDTAPEPVVEAPSSSYYANCDAARADGAAPVRVGDPGYGRHLDRDGDGVGCE